MSWKIRDPDPEEEDGYEMERSRGVEPEWINLPGRNLDSEDDMKTWIRKDALTGEIKVSIYGAPSIAYLKNIMRFCDMHGVTVPASGMSCTCLPMQSRDIVSYFVHHYSARDALALLSDANCVRKFGFVDSDMPALHEAKRYLAEMITDAIALEQKYADNVTTPRPI